MTQSIVIQVGQCGNQIGCRFWDLCLREHSHFSKRGIYDHAVGSFFRNTDGRGDSIVDLPIGNSASKIKNLKARAVLIDMEEGVVNELLQGYLSDIFDSKQLITDVSGSGNNWAVGNLEYGVRYREEITDLIRKSAELCDCLQCFFILHSMGGGTGSGLGTAVLRLLADEFPDVYRFVCSVYPSKDDDVITSPYNSVLAMHELTECADCVLPINNESLASLCNRIYDAKDMKKGKSVVKSSTVTSGAGSLGSGQNEKPFDHMNNIVANLILNMTSSSRFEGSLNVDLNEFAMNLVPYPKLHYLVSSISPLYINKDVGLPPRKLNQAFDDLFCADNQLMAADPKNSVYLACALMARGPGVHMSDIRNNIARIKRNLEFVKWNQEGWKTGLCNVSPVGLPYSLLGLSNNTCIRYSFNNLQSRFVKLYQRKAHIHHYQGIDGFESSFFDESLHSVRSLVKEYEDIEKSSGMGYYKIPPQMKVM